MLSKSIAVGFATTVTTLALTTGATLFDSVQPATAATIAEYTEAGGFVNLFPGQSVTTGSSSLPWNNITFNWFSDVPATTPTAFGTLFLLSSEYLGTPAALSAATPGFLAQSQSISGGQYIFDPSVTLQANTQYFFYANAGGRFISAILPGTYVGGSAYGSNSSNTPFSSSLAGLDVTFRLSGTPIPTPALLPGLVGMGVVAFRKRRAEAKQAAEKV
jgi:hypothetical protein